MKYEKRQVFLVNGYPAICLKGMKYIHRIEWEKHYGEIPKGYIIVFKDGDKTNWAIDNLKLIKRSEFIAEKNSKLSQSDIKEIQKNYKPYDENCGGCALSKKYGVSKMTIHRVAKGDR